ncbi:hypothetical protein [Paenibacillus qinlingensis]|uniref:Uncharacterized protein n=1 Tax=Paenibacillus qinlingensis TaxID=1837343 RepID=A0ABU1NR26_9BACL|nr:hypothetical protein [Paenibacillus qinlingensis]MDR6549868.1 hypothetical protein [Paenibacillus qinlingensis]
MKLYERSIKLQLVTISLMFFLTLVQIIINIAAKSPVIFVSIFSLCLGVFLILAVIICIDLVQNDAEKMTAKVEFMEEYRVHIRKPNGKLMKVRVKPTEYEQFYVEQSVELLTAKRTHALLTIHSLTAPIEQLEEDQ